MVERIAPWRCPRRGQQYSPFGRTLQYTGTGGNTNRLFSVTPTNGSIDSSGTGAINFNNGSGIVSADATSRGTTNESTANGRVTLPSVDDFVVGMSVTGTNILPGTTIASINPGASSITLSSFPTLAGSDTLSFGVVSRSLTLTGTNTGANTDRKPAIGLCWRRKTIAR